MTNVNTYNGLLTSIQQWANRNDQVFINNIPLFISLAEQQFFIDCPVLGTEAALTGVFSANNSVIPKPALWGQTLTFSYIDASNNTVILERIPYETIRAFAPINNVIPTTTYPLAGNPQYYSDYGFNFILVSPTPVLALNFELIYLQKVQPLSISNQTNWVSQYAYDALFDITMYFAYRFLDNTPNADYWYTKYQDRVAAINNYDIGRRSDRTYNALRG